MPSPRKRIGFLPRPVVQELIREIANVENLSQSKVVGILVEEALLARGIISPHISNDLKRKTSMDNNKNVNPSSYLYNDMNELISDKGITYKKSTINMKRTEITKDLSIEDKENDAELFKKFSEIIEFKKLMES